MHNVVIRQRRLRCEAQCRAMLAANKGKIERELELYMKRPVPEESASALIDEKIKELGDWRGKTLAKVREIIHEADPEIVEEWKWMGTPVWSHGGLVWTGETYKNVVKMTLSRRYSRGLSSVLSFLPC